MLNRWARTVAPSTCLAALALALGWPHGHAQSFGNGGAVSNPHQPVQQAQQPQSGAQLPLPATTQIPPPNHVPKPVSDTLPSKTAQPVLSVMPAKPMWSQLTLEQQQALSPLATEWDQLDATQKQKWLVIGKKYSAMKPDQQIRLQERMRDWAKLSSAERRAARETYSKSKKIDPTRKSAQWEQYQQLPEEEKKKLAQAAAKNRVANLPPPSEGKDKSPVPPKNKPKPNVKPTQPIPPAAATSATPGGKEAPRVLPAPGTLASPLGGAQPATQPATPSGQPLTR